MNSQLSGLARGSLKFRPSAVRSGPPCRDALLDVGLQIFPVRGGPARLTVYASGASSIEADPCCIEDGGGGLTVRPP